MPLEDWSDSIVVVHLADEPQFSEDIDALEDRVSRDPAGAVLDFSAVNYINSTNIARMIKLRRDMHERHCRLVLCGMSNDVWSVFLVTGLDKVFETGDDVPTALASLQL
jgi:anti-anti-sigma factor